MTDNVIDARILFLKKQIKDMANSDFLEGIHLAFMLAEIVEMVEKIEWRYEHGRIDNNPS